MAQSCVSLAGSTTCPAFNTSSISTTTSVARQFSFLSNVTDAKSFDTALRQYVRNGYVQEKYGNLFGCSNIDTSNTTDFYARYTFSFICNALVQTSIEPCQLSAADSRPLCADTCGEFATSEQTIISSPDLCDTSSPNVDGQLRADYTNCGLPNDALTANCIHGYQNEGADCGFQYNLQGLCTFCGASSINATDSCCVTSNVESRCRNVQLPRYTSMQPFTTNLPSATPTPTPGSNSSSGGGSGLSGGQIAGIVVGSVVGAILLLALLICCCIAVRRRRQNRSSMSSLNQPTPPRSGASGGMSQMGKPPPFEALPGARVTRMTALEGFQDGSPGQGDSSGFDTSPESQAGMAGAAAAVPVRKGNNDGVDDSSPDSGDFSSPDGNGQSERMSSFKDYYSQDEIHSGDHVAVLWAYQPRAPDEFELERGDMVKIVGIWDDGWATGVRVSHRAEDWSPSRTTGHDSVVSNESARGGSADSEIKAFPHWRRTIEGEPSSPPSERDQ